MSEVKKPVQETIEFKGTEYVVQKLPALDAFLKRESLEFGELLVYLIDNCVVHPNIKAADMETPNDIRDLGLLIFAYNYNSKEDLEKIKKNLEEE